MSSFRKHFGNRRPKESKEEKYGNKPMTCALGHSHRSKLEGAVCAILQWREKAGEIRIRQVEKHLYLSLAKVVYIADWEIEYVATGVIGYAEAKGYEDPKWPNKLKLYRVYGPGPLEIWRGNHGKPFLDEIVNPEPDLFPEGKCPQCGYTKNQKGAPA